MVYQVSKRGRAKSKADRLAEALTKLKIDEAAVGEIRDLAEELRSWADGMPENLQQSDKHARVEEAAGKLSELADALDELTDSVAEAGGLDWS